MSINEHQLDKKRRGLSRHVWQNSGVVNNPRRRPQAILY